MSDRTEKFFSWVWRVNGLLLLALAVTGVVGALAVLINLAVFSSRERPADQLQRIAGADVGSDELKLGSFRSIAGTQLVYAPLASPSEYVGSGSSGGLGSTHNLLFFDTSSKKAHWLLPTNAQTITSYYFLLDPPSSRFAFHEGEAEEADQRATAILLELRDAENKAGSIAVASPDGRTLAAVADQAEGLLGFHQVRADAVLVFYISAGAARVVDLDPMARKVRSDDLLSTGD